MHDSIIANEWSSRHGSASTRVLRLLFLCRGVSGGDKVDESYNREAANDGRFLPIVHSKPVDRGWRRRSWRISFLAQLTIFRRIPTVDSGRRRWR